MKYDDILNELKKHDLNGEFIKDIEKYLPKSLIDKIKKSENINSTASLIRILISHTVFKSDDYIFWVDILQYYIKPEFMRDEFNLKTKK